MDVTDMHIDSKTRPYSWWFEVLVRRREKSDEETMREEEEPWRCHKETFLLAVVAVATVATVVVL